MKGKLNSVFEDVKQFHMKFGHSAPDKPELLGKTNFSLKEARIEFMEEELIEYKFAQTIEDEADAMIDLIYFAVGTLVSSGVEPSILWDIVHKANMDKLQPDGSVKKKENGKIIKPESWEDPGPKMKLEIERQTSEGS